MNKNLCSWLTLALRTKICSNRISVRSCLCIDREFTIRVNMIPEGKFGICRKALQEILASERVHLEIH